MLLLLLLSCFSSCSIVPGLHRGAPSLLVGAFPLNEDQAEEETDEPLDNLPLIQVGITNPFPYYADKPPSPIPLIQDRARALSSSVR
jgi:hypothetical protein